MSKKIILVTDTSSSFSRFTFGALARAGHTIYASRAMLPDETMPMESCTTPHQHQF